MKILGILYLALSIVMFMLFAVAATMSDKVRQKGIKVFWFSVVASFLWPVTVVAIMWVDRDEDGFKDFVERIKDKLRS